MSWSHQGQGPAHGGLGGSVPSTEGLALSVSGWTGAHPPRGMGTAPPHAQWERAPAQDGDMGTGSWSPCGPRLSGASHVPGPGAQGRGGGVWASVSGLKGKASESETQRRGMGSSEEEDGAGTHDRRRRRLRQARRPEGTPLESPETWHRRQAERALRPCGGGPRSGHSERTGPGLGRARGTRGTAGSGPRRAWGARGRRGRAACPGSTQPVRLKR